MSEITSPVNSNKDDARWIRIVLADDHPLLREALRNRLEKQLDFEIVGEANDGEELIRLVKTITPDIIILDISMPILNGLEATRQIKTDYPQIYILVLSVYNDNEHVVGMLEAGADGYLVKTVSGTEVIHAIRALVAGETVLSPSISKQIFKYAFQHVSKPLNLNMGNNLSTREIELLRLIAKGVSNKDIAKTLGLSLNSVKTYLANIFSKLNARSRVEALVISLRLGIITQADIDEH
jgi:DNA-binding NarL/FixJ family response regulator